MPGKLGQTRGTRKKLEITSHTPKKQGLSPRSDHAIHGITQMKSNQKYTLSKRLICSQIRFPARSLGIIICRIAVAIVMNSALALAQEPTITPMPGKPALRIGEFDITALGYRMDEFSFAGVATSYKSAGQSGLDNERNVIPAETAPYVTRIVVIRPNDQRKFNGTVVVEWMNVSAGLDVPVDWNMMHREITRRGYAFVAVSAQKVGIEGGGFSLVPGTTPLKVSNPARYGKLAHPGDAFAFDIYSQVGARLRTRSAELLGNLIPERLIAVGESQSAAFLTTYANSVDPLAKSYDGILIHSRVSGSGPLLGDSSLLSIVNSFRQVVTLRSNLRVPVIQVITETDLMGFGIGQFYKARQPDSDRLRTWEIAGTAHADNYSFSVGAIDSGSVTIDQMVAAWAPTRSTPIGQTDKAINNGPQHHYVVESALWHLDRWLTSGAAPPRAAPIEVTVGNAPKIVIDPHGIAQGGVRSPWVDVPISRLSGSGNGGAVHARMLGSCQPFDKEQLDRLYPGGKDDYLKKFERSLTSAIAAGFILAADKQEIMELAAASYPHPN
jgi:hypothetical protein